MNSFEIFASEKDNVKNNINTSLPNTSSIDDNVTGAFNLGYGIAGVLAVVVIIFAGVTYVTSVGDPNKTKKALHIIIYALVGLAIVISAAFITNFVLGNAA